MVLQRLFTFASAAALLLSMGIAGLWIRSHYVHETVWWTINDTWYALQSLDGSASLGTYTAYPTFDSTHAAEPLGRSGYRRSLVGPDVISTTPMYPDFALPGIKYREGTWQPSPSSSTEYPHIWLIVHYALPTFLATAVPALWLIIRYRCPLRRITAPVVRPLPTLLRFSLKALPLLLLIASLAMWLRSWHYVDRFHAYRICLDSSCGRVFLFIEDSSSIFSSSSIFVNSSPGPRDFDKDDLHFDCRWRFAKFCYGHASDASLVIGVPYWFLSTVPAAMIALQLRARHTRHRRSRLGLCPTCGYDLRASKEKCPECGRPIPTPSNPSSQSVQSSE